VVWNRKTGQPIHHAIVWQDRRAEPTCAAAARARPDRPIQQKTGLVIDAYFSGTKLKWILDNVPGARAPRARRAGLRHGRQLADVAADRRPVHVTDVSNASRTMLFNVHTTSGTKSCWKRSTFPRT
jgi:glycerol kinase